MKDIPLRALADYAYNYPDKITHEGIRDLSNEFRNQYDQNQRLQETLEKIARQIPLNILTKVIEDSMYQRLD